MLRRLPLTTQFVLAAPGVVLSLVVVAASAPSRVFRCSVVAAAQVDHPLSEQNLPWREKVLVTGPDVMFEVMSELLQVTCALDFGGYNVCVFCVSGTPPPSAQNKRKCLPRSCGWVGCFFCRPGTADTTVVAWQPLARAACLTPPPSRHPPHITLACFDRWWISTRTTARCR